MKDNLGKILDECIDRINHGEGIENCLAEYPEHRQELASLLQAILETKSAYSFTPSIQAKSFYKQKLNEALVVSRERRKKRRPLLNWVSGRFKVWAPVVAAIAIALVGYFSLRSAMAPQVIIAQENNDGNFAFLISDEVNAINDFKELNVSISSIILHSAGADEKQIRLEMGMQAVDLTDLQGNRAQEIWRGDVPDGEYSKVFLEVSGVTGILLTNGEEIAIKLPSGKLQVSTPFEVDNAGVTNYIFDLTVVETGKSGNYILKPQAGQSGVDQDFFKIEPEEQPVNNEKPQGNNSARDADP